MSSLSLSLSLVGPFLRVRERVGVLFPKFQTLNSPLLRRTLEIRHEHVELLFVFSHAPRLGERDALTVHLQGHRGTPQSKVRLSFGLLKRARARAF